MMDDDMRTCPQCGQKFKHINQVHSCGEKELEDFLGGKSEVTLELFWYFVQSFRKIGSVTIHPTKSLVAVAAGKRIAYVIQLGENFVDIVFKFDQPYEDNLCFRKIAQVPGKQQFNHHLRIMSKDDLNKEVRRFMKLAYELSAMSS